MARSCAGLILHAHCSVEHKHVFPRILHDIFAEVSDQIGDIRARASLIINRYG